MQISPKSELFRENILSSSQALVVFLLLAVFTADAVSILYVFGLFSLWESVVTLVTVLALAGGTIWSILWISRTT